MSWEKDGVWILKSCKLNSKTDGVIKLSLAAVVHHIWWERNLRKFQNKARSIQQIIQTIVDEVKLKIEDCSRPTICTKRNLFVARQWKLTVQWSVKNALLVSWPPPQRGWVCLNTDGAFSSSRGGFGALLRNEVGIPLIAVAGAGIPKSVIHAEVTALKEGIDAAIRVGVNKLVIQSDSLLLVRWIQDRRGCPWRIEPLLDEVFEALKFLNHWKISHVYREANRPADWLASLLVDFGKKVFSPSEIPKDLALLIDEDRVGSLVPRGFLL